MNKKIKSMLVLFSMVAVFVTSNIGSSAKVSAATSRDAAYWPFSSTSPWNMPIGDEITYTDETSVGFDPNGGANINSSTWSHPIFISSASDPVRTISGSPEGAVSMNVPSNAAADNQTDGHMHVIDKEHTYVVETFQAIKDSNGDFTATNVVKNSLFDDGIYPGWHGVRAYGGSAIAGLIRAGELTNGIHHALAIALDGPGMNKNAPDGKCYVWPASSCDWDYATSYASTGNIYMGSFLIIPPTIDLSTIKPEGRALTTEGYNLAYALQHYGSYVTDRAGANIAFSAEKAAENEPALQWGSEFQTDLDEIVKYLKVATNNSATNVGGPGNRIEAMAPPFSGGLSPGAYAAANTAAMITVNGELTESDWSFTQSASKVVVGTNNNSVTFGSLWDTDYLYVGVKVIDGNLYNDSTNIWDDDSVEVYIDANHNHGATYDSFDRQFTKGYTDSFLGGIGSQTGVLHGWAAITGGYSVEYAIPWSNLGVTPTAGMTIGFDIGNNDDDNAGVRDGQSVWYGTANNANNTSEFGDLILIGTGDTQAPTVPTNLTTSSKTAGTVDLSWTASTDNVIVIGYGIFKDGVLAGSTTGATTFTVTGLTASTSYSFTVKAKDSAGNVSAASSAINVTTNELFVKGINLNGSAVVIDGDNWISYSSALSSGLSVSNGSMWSGIYDFALNPSADSATKTMLESVVYRQGAANGQGITLNQTMVNGSYKVYLWMIENFQNNFRNMNVKMEGTTVASNIGDLALGSWVKYGPYNVTVSDGVLNIEVLKSTKGDPTLAGLAIFQ